MNRIRKIIAVASIALKSYYIKTTNGINLVGFPLIMITIFMLQKKQYDGLEKLNLLINALILVNLYSSINTLATTIAYDKFLLRIKLYQASYLNYYEYLIGMLLSSLLMGIFSQIVTIIIFSIGFQDLILLPNILFFILISFLFSCSISFLGALIGFYSKDLVNAHSISNMVTGFLALGGGVFFSLQNLPCTFLIKIFSFTPTAIISNLYFNIFTQSTDGSISHSYVYLFFCLIFSMSILFLKKRWAKI